MKKADIEIGKTYAARISGSIIPVRILRESRFGGWDGRHARTDRQVRIKTAGKLRWEIEDTGRIEGIMGRSLSPSDAGDAASPNRETEGDHERVRGCKDYAKRF